MEQKHPIPFYDIYYDIERTVSSATEMGLINGMSATSFGINVICNRAQIVTFLSRHR